MSATAGLILAAYLIGCLPATICAFEAMPAADGYTYFARVVLWPLFLAKAIGKMLLAGVADLRR